MKADKRILTAFILNLSFSIFEFFGGALTGSIAIISDAVHDFGDALAIGLSFVMERKSKRSPDERYTYGYGRYSLLGGAITSLILLLGSTMVVYNAIGRLLCPQEIDSDSMIVFAVIGFAVNFTAAISTHGSHSANMRAVSLHMLEDVLGWAAVLVGAVIIRFTGWGAIDPLLSLGIAVFISTSSIKNLAGIRQIFLESVPGNIDVSVLKANVLKIDVIIDVHHIHLWSIDEFNPAATMHVVSSNHEEAKKRVRQELKRYGINHVTIETESFGEACAEPVCIKNSVNNSCHHHH